MKPLLSRVAMIVFFCNCFCIYSPLSAQDFSRNFLPENDLDKYDWANYDSAVTEEVFNRVIDVALEVFQPVADKYGETISIARNWTSSTVNANVKRMGSTVYINMYGGLARRPEINEEGFALVLCHELGHAYGGTPFLNATTKIAAEGQADYYGAGVCLKKIISVIVEELKNFSPTSFMKSTCSGSSVCLYQLHAGLALGELLSVIKNQNTPSYETPDNTEVQSTVLSYPNTVQCRLDTYYAGVVGKNRPACWYAGR
ncbi:MAG: hypothetical protein HQK54_09340 [Oligoflexales bacterium]|nr:hypothetical protein [Oligoflexales bacterium]